MTLTHFFSITTRAAKDYSWARYDYNNSLGLTSALAASLADQIVRLRCKRCTAHYASWQAAAAGGQKPTGPTLDALHAYLSPAIGLPGSAPVSENHLEGLIAEHLWYFLITSEATLNNTIHVEPPSFKPTDHGGDGLSVRRNGDGSLTFFLWEIKKRVGKGRVSGTINQAALQLKTEALEYLARYTCTADLTGDPALEDLFAHLVEYWEQASPSASAGIAVASNLSNASNRCFTSLPKHLATLTSPPRLVGKLTTFGDFSAFTLAVRDRVWTGL